MPADRGCRRATETGRQIALGSGRRQARIRLHDDQDHAQPGGDAQGHAQAPEDHVLQGPEPGRPLGPLAAPGQVGLAGLLGAGRDDVGDPLGIGHDDGPDRFGHVSQRRAAARPRARARCPSHHSWGRPRRRAGPRERRRWRRGRPASGRPWHAGRRGAGCRPPSTCRRTRSQAPRATTTTRRKTLTLQARVRPMLRPRPRKAGQPLPSATSRVNQMVSSDKEGEKGVDGEIVGALDVQHGQGQQEGGDAGPPASRRAGGPGKRASSTEPRSKRPDRTRPTRWIWS